MGENSEIGTLFTQHRMPPLCERADASTLHGPTRNFARMKLTSRRVERMFQKLKKAKSSGPDEIRTRNLLIWLIGREFRV